MKQIPVKIIEITSPSGQTAKEVMLDVYDYYEMEGDVQKKIKDFKKLYFETVTKAEKLFYGNKDKKTKYQNLPSSVYWKLGNILSEFNNKIETEFEITNYVEALFRDFGLSKDYVYDLLTIAKLIKKKDILDLVPFSYYRALKRKRSQLKKLGIFDRELKRLNQLGIKGELPGREAYKIELIEIITKNAKKMKKKGGKLS